LEGNKTKEAGDKGQQVYPGDFNQLSTKLGSMSTKLSNRLICPRTQAREKSTKILKVTLHRNNFGDGGDGRLLKKIDLQGN